MNGDIYNKQYNCDIRIIYLYFVIDKNSEINDY